MTSHYEILEVSETASPEAIRASFRRLARRHHPDRGGSAEAFQKIESAYAILMDAAKRTAYDDARRSRTTRDDTADNSEGPPQPEWGTERTVDPQPTWGTESTVSPDSPQPPQAQQADPLWDVRRWSAPPLPAPPDQPRRSRTMTVVGIVALALCGVVFGTYFVTALSPLDVTGVPIAFALLVAVCTRRSFSSRAAPWSLIAEIVLALPGTVSAETVLNAPADAMRGTGADVVSILAGCLALLAAGGAILAAELWRAGARRAAVRHAGALAAYQHACRTKELAEHWQQMLLKSALPDLQLMWVVNASPTGPKTNALLEDPRTGHRANRWLWERWDPGIWMVVNDRTGEVVHWAAAEARDAWDLIGPRA